MKKSKSVIFKYLVNTIPVFSTFLIFILSFIFNPFFGIKSMLVLIPIFFWGSEKVLYFDFVSIMIFGFFQDFIDGTRLGINIFIFLSIYFFTYYQKFFTFVSSFFYSYLLFFVVISLALLLKFLILYLFFLDNISFRNVLFSIILLNIYYPIIYLFLQKLNLKSIERQNA